MHCPENIILEIILKFNINLDHSDSISSKDFLKYIGKS